MRSDERRKGKRIESEEKRRKMKRREGEMR